MRYFGGKAKLKNQIIEFINENVKEIDNYYEPFCGMCSVLNGIKAKNKFANDRNESLIMLLKEVKEKTFKYEEITKEKWNQLKEQEYHSSLKAFAQFSCSYLGMNFNSYINYSCNSDKQMRTLENLNLNDVTFTSLDYKEFLTNLPSGSVIYMDPPYTPSNKRDKKINDKAYGSFDSDLFWEFVNLLKGRNYHIFVSESRKIDNYVKMKIIERKNKGKVSEEYIYYIN